MAGALGVIRVGPIRVKTFNASTSPVATGTGLNASKATTASFASEAFRVTPVMQRCRPDATTVPFFESSTLRSNWVPWSSPFFSPIQRWAGLAAVSVEQPSVPGLKPEGGVPVLPFTVSTYSPVLATLPGSTCTR